MAAELKKEQEKSVKCLRRLGRALADADGFIHYPNVDSLFNKNVESSPGFPESGWDVYTYLLVNRIISSCGKDGIHKAHLDDGREMGPPYEWVAAAGAISDCVSIVPVQSENHYLQLENIGFLADSIPEENRDKLNSLLNETLLHLRDLLEVSDP